MRRLLSVVLAGALVLTVAGTTLAAKGGNKGNAGVGGHNSGAGTCVVTPDPASLGGQYTVTGGGLPANTFVNVDVSDSVGTSVYMAMTDTSGAVSVTGWSAWAGTSTVAIVQPGGHKTSTLASCSFQVT